MNKELLQQALDALLESYGLAPLPIARRFEAIAALRAAIAQPVQSATTELAAEREKVRVLREALGRVIERFGPCQQDYSFSKRIALDQARAALTQTGTTT